MILIMYVVLMFLAFATYQYFRKHKVNHIIAPITVMALLTLATIMVVI